MANTVAVKKRRGRPPGSVENKAIREAMKRKFGKIISPRKFGELVELIYGQAMEGEKQSQKLIFEYAMVKPGFEPEERNKDHNIQIIINDMKPEKEEIIEGEIIED
jgi:MinD superfamily P-loop ATPase